MTSPHPRRLAAGTALGLALASALVHHAPAIAQSPPRPSTAQAPTPPAGALADPAVVAPTITLAALIDLARRGNPGLAAVRARVDVAQGGLISARAIPNPEIELQGGRQGARSDGTQSGGTGQLGMLLPIDRPSLREARRDVAVTGIDAARTDARVAERNLVAEVKLRYFEVLRLQAAARLAEEDLSIAEQIRTRVQVRVGTGEAPRFELIRADTERLNAQRALQAAVARIDVARSELRRQVGPQLPVDFALAGNIGDEPGAPPPLETVRAEMLERHPELQAARAALRNAD